MKFIRDDRGKWSVKKEKNVHPSYQNSLKKYLNVLEPFFNLAKQKSEFEYIFTLLNVKGASSPGWDTFDTIKNAHKSFYIIQKKLKNERAIEIQYLLLLYGLIIEASEPYEIIANLINVIKGDRYIVRTHFPDYKDQNGRNRKQSPADKIAQLKKKSKKVNLSLEIFDEFFDNNLRNSIFHSDYTVYNNEIRTMNPKRIYMENEWLNLINKTLAYFESFVIVYDFHKSEYKTPKLVKPHPDFSSDPFEMCKTIVRKGYGLIGLKDNFTEEEIKKGKIPHLIGKYYPYEQKLINEGMDLLPKDKIKRINNILHKLPASISRKIVKIIDNN